MGGKDSLFTGLDFAFFLAYMVIVMVIGFVVGRREQQTVKDYFRAGNTLPWYAVGFSIIAAGISSEQFVGEIGYAYANGMPVVNWDWLIFPALSILLWVFIPMYIRNRITTMPEYLERRYGPTSRTIYSLLIVASYIFANFALVFYTAGFMAETLWGVDARLAVFVIAVTTGAYTIYGGLKSVAYTDLFQAVLLLGGGIFVFFSGMNMLDWDFARVIGTGDRAHLISGGNNDLPWTAMVILALSTNVWYYATDQFINQRCLGAKNEWHAKTGVLLAGGLQLILPLATCFPGMIYFALNPDLAVADEAYPRIVALVVPAGLRGIVVAAVAGAIMSTISGLVNSTSTMFTLDILKRWKGKDWSEPKLVRYGQFVGAAALICGAGMAEAVKGWENMFRYCQDIWAPMAAPAVVVFLGGALWKGGKERGAVWCMWLSVLTVPVVFIKQLFLDCPDPVHIMPGYLENSMVFAGGVFMTAVVLLVVMSNERLDRWYGIALSAAISAMIFALTSVSAEIIALMVLVTVIGSLIYFMATRSEKVQGMWDRSMLRLPEGEKDTVASSVRTWWIVIGACFVAIYWYFW